MEYKKSKEMLVAPIIFMILFIVAIILMAIYLSKNVTSVIILGLSIPSVLLILDIVYLIFLIVVPNVILRIDSNALYYKNLEIPLTDIEYTAVRRGVIRDNYHPYLLIMLKDKESIRVRFLADPYETSKEINKKYLHLKGNWVK